MPTIDQAKAMAKRLRSALASNTIEVTHGTSLELVAAQLGHHDWNTAAATLASDQLGKNIVRAGGSHIPHLRRGESAGVLL